MYLEHFGLTEPPFRITPHTDFFFSGGNRGATLDALIYAITHDEGIVKVSGEVGSGKTMLCRVLMERLPEHVNIIYLANPSLSRDDILYAIADELRLEIPENSRAAVVLRALQDHLIKSFSEGRQVVVLIDEAHAMPVETLEEIRLLSNLESNRSKLLQLVLFGQPELNDVLARPDMRQLKERITHNFMLEPLIRDDVAGYLEFRMRAAGYKGPSVFSPKAIKAIAAVSLGLTRRINILADKSLLAAFSENTHQIGEKQVGAAIKDCDFSNLSFRTASKQQGARLAWTFAVAVLICGAAIAYILAVRSEIAATDTLKTSSDTPHPATATESEKAIASSPPQPMPSALASEPPNTLVVAAPQKTDPPTQSGNAYGHLTREHLDASQKWLREADSSRWFLQLFATDKANVEMIEDFLASAIEAGINPDQLRIYESDLSGSPRVGIIYGEFKDSQSARQQISKLPKTLRNSHPFPRQVIRLR